MTQAYLAAIQDLITENQQIKADNRKLTGFCEDLLDDIVQFFGQFFPTIPTFDSNSLQKACSDIITYYKKQLLIVKTELSKQLIQILNMYDIQLQDELEASSFDNLKQFVNLMKGSKGSLKQQLFQHQLHIEELQTIKNSLEKQIRDKQIAFKKLSIVFQEQAGDLERVSNSNELLSIEVSNLSKQLRRSHDQYQTLEADYNAAQAELRQEKLISQQLRRQIINLQQQRMPNRMISIKLDRKPKPES